MRILGEILRNWHTISVYIARNDMVQHFNLALITYIIMMDNFNHSLNLHIEPTRTANLKNHHFSPKTLSLFQNIFCRSKNYIQCKAIFGWKSALWVGSQAIQALICWKWIFRPDLVKLEHGSYNFSILPFLPHQSIILQFHLAF